MGQALRNWRIAGATALSITIVTGAYLLARDAERPPIAQASSEAALLAAIATKDSDHDGLPDWQEALYGTDPHNPDTRGLGMTDGEAVARGLIVPKAISDIQVATSVPATSADQSYAGLGLPAPVRGTITDAFSKLFFQLYLAAKAGNGGADLTSTQASDLIAKTFGQFSANFSLTPDFKSASDLRIAGSGQDALRTFAAQAEAVFEKNRADVTKSETDYLADALNGDGTALTRLAAFSKTYRDSAAGLSALTVPQELAPDTLTVINALMRLGEIDGDLARVDVDPLAAMLALEQFPKAEGDAERAFADIAGVYAAAGITLRQGEPGASFVNLIANLAAAKRDAAGTKTP